MRKKKNQVSPLELQAQLKMPVMRMEKVFSENSWTFDHGQEMRYLLMHPEIEAKEIFSKIGSYSFKNVLPFVTYILTTEPYISRLVDLEIDRAVLLLNQRALHQELGDKVGDIAKDFEEICKNVHLSSSLQ